MKSGVRRTLILIFITYALITENFLHVHEYFLHFSAPHKELTQRNLSLPSDLGVAQTVLKNTSSVKCMQELCERKCCPPQIHFGNTG